MPEVAPNFCRVCGRPVENPKALMHPECRATDKARRVARKRAKDLKRWVSWLKLVLKGACDTSQRTAIIAKAEAWGQGPSRQTN